MVTPTQVHRPWRATVRTMVQAAISLAIIADPIYEAITKQDPAAATGYAAAALAIAGGITRLMAMPQIEEILRSTPGLRWLAAHPGHDD